MYCVFKKSLVTQKRHRKNEELHKQAAIQRVPSHTYTEHALTKYGAFTEDMGWETVSKRRGVKESVIIENQRRQPEIDKAKQ